MSARTKVALTTAIAIALVLLLLTARPLFGQAPPTPGAMAPPQSVLAALLA